MNGETFGFGTTSSSGPPPPVPGCMTNVTYAQIVAMINASSLSPGCFYCITNYQSKNFLQGNIIANSDPTKRAVYTATIEQIVVQALSANTLYQQASSKSYPEDILYYDVTKSALTVQQYIDTTTAPDPFVAGYNGVNMYIDLPYNLVAGTRFEFTLFDAGFTTGASEVFDSILLGVSIAPNQIYAGLPATNITIQNGVGIYGATGCRIILDAYLVNIGAIDPSSYAVVSLSISATNGQVYRRIDTERNINIPIDWRNYKYRRWEMDIVGTITGLAVAYWGWDSSITLPDGTVVNATTPLTFIDTDIFVNSEFQSQLKNIIVRKTFDNCVFVKDFFDPIIFDINASVLEYSSFNRLKGISILTARYSMSNSFDFEGSCENVFIGGFSGKVQGMYNVIFAVMQEVDLVNLFEVYGTTTTNFLNNIVGRQFSENKFDIDASLVSIVVNSEFRFYLIQTPQPSSNHSIVVDAIIGDTAAILPPTKLFKNVTGCNILLTTSGIEFANIRNCDFNKAFIDNGVAKLIDGSPSFAIIAVTIGLNGTFTVAGDRTNILPPGQGFSVIGSTGNNGNKTVLTSVFGAGVTVISITGTVLSAVADGSVVASFLSEQASKKIWFNAGVGVTAKTFTSVKYAGATPITTTF